MQQQLRRACDIKSKTAVRRRNPMGAKVLSVMKGYNTYE